MQTIRPLSHTSNVQPNVVVLLRGTAQREWMPLVFGDRRNVHENVISRPEAEVGGPFDNQVGDFGGQQDSRGDVRLAPF